MCCKSSNPHKGWKQNMANNCLNMYYTMLNVKSFNGSSYNSKGCFNNFTRFALVEYGYS